MPDPAWNRPGGLLFPGLCLACGEGRGEGEDRLCAECRPAFRLPSRGLCQHCLARNDTATEICLDCLSQAPAWTQASCLWPFHGAAREVVHRYKYQGDEKARRVVLEHLPLALAGVAIPRPDAVCAVPMHWLKRLWRGHCAASQLARDAARLLAVPQLHLLRRRRVGKPQHELDREHRRKAVLDLYELTPRAQIPSGTILLVDDVLTTGATLDTCARLLLEGGAGEVRVLTLARG